jgi:1-acyl-sn-glycerol-3-phosphate acyltransferase
MDLLNCITQLVRHLQRLEIEGIDNLPSQGPALIATTHSTPLDFFYHLALMQRLGREDYHFVVAAEFLDQQLFRAYAGAALRDTLPALARPLGLLADGLSHVIPGLFRRLDAIPVHRTGDDSAARRQCVEWLLRGQLVTIAPEWGNDRHRNAQGLRPLTYGLASITRQYFDQVRQPLSIVPVGIAHSGLRVLPRVRMRVGPPLHGLSNHDDPELFSDTAGCEAATKQRAYQRFTEQLAARLTELL